MAKGNMLIKDLKPSKKTIYLFSFNYDDFALNVGMQPFKATTGEFNRKLIGFDEHHTYLYCQSYLDIRGMRNIEVEYTPKFLAYWKGNRRLMRVHEEVDICNFQYSDYIDPEKIPKVLRELMGDL